MRGRVDYQDEIFHSFNLEEMIPTNHPLRAIKARVDGILTGMSRRFCHRAGKTVLPHLW
ncbi:MAG TPA: hypothetical protein VMZ31_04665 [Phycisphaerae bacterium]|nr:hypothetical protein [Phycisphaerae bacterium]